MKSICTVVCTAVPAVQSHRNLADPGHQSNILLQPLLLPDQTKLSYFSATRLWTGQLGPDSVSSYLIAT